MRAIIWNCIWEHSRIWRLSVSVQLAPYHSEFRMSFTSPEYFLDLQGERKGFSKVLIIGISYCSVSTLSPQYVIKLHKGLAQESSRLLHLWHFLWMVYRTLYIDVIMAKVCYHCVITSHSQSRMEKRRFWKHLCTVFLILSPSQACFLSNENASNFVLFLLRQT